MTNISFPGLGIAPFTVDPVAFAFPYFGGIEVRWYGIILTLGIVLAFLYTAFRAKQEGIQFEDTLDITIFTVIFAIVGARLYYVLTSLEKYDSFYEAIAIWEGGIAIYGAIIAGAITVMLVCKFKKIKFLKMFDATAPGVMLGQIIGRWGNFCNGEAFGVQIPESSPLYFIRMGLQNKNTFDDFGTRTMVYVHPTFLYESLWNLCGFVLINILYKKKKFDGQVVLMYAAWYGFGRMLIEGLRTDSLYVGVFRISQVVGFVCFAVCTLLLVLGLMKARRARLGESSYEPAYPQFATSAAAKDSKSTENPSAENTDGNTDGNTDENTDKTEE